MIWRHNNCPNNAVTLNSGDDNVTMDMFPCLPLHKLDGIVLFWRSATNMILFIFVMLVSLFFVKSKSNEHNLIISWTTLVHLYKNIIFKTSSDLLFRDQICCNNTEHTEEENILVIRTHPTTTDRCIKAGSHCGETDHAGRATVMPRNTTALFRTPVRLDESRLFKQQHLRHQHDFCNA